MKKAINFMKKHPIYSSSVHAIGGIGVGILIASPVAGAHPVRWGLAFIVVAIAGHIYAFFS